MRTVVSLTFTTALLLSVSAFAADAANNTASDAGRPPMDHVSGKPGSPRPPMLTEEQKKSLHDCAKEGGVDLPPPSKDGPPKLTEDQHKIVHACFEKLGIKRPPHPPQSGPGGDHPPMDHPPIDDNQ